MALEKPSEIELRKLARTNHFSLSTKELNVFKEEIGSTLTSFRKLEWLERQAKKVSLPRRRRVKGRAPNEVENKFGAWAWRCSIREKVSGLLFGKKIAIKDNIPVAGLSMRNGSPILQNFVPLEDATIVSRVLNAGAEIVGKAQCENLCVSGGSHTSYPKPVRNPHNPEYMAGGSSSGSAALLALGQVDMAIGGDQAGSIRIPASWCGVYGLKPTWGLVPYTGAMPLEITLDHVGPMANSVRNVALLLEVIVGRDQFDPRQRNTPFTLPRYSQKLFGGVKGMKIGVVKEGFELKRISEPDVDEMVRAQVHIFERLGADVSEVSIPPHIEGVSVWTGIAMEGTWSTVVRDNGLEHLGYNSVYTVESWARARKKNSTQFPPTMKLIALCGNYMAEKYNGRYFAMAKSMANWLRQRYDEALHRYDLLVMPTTPQKAQKLRENLNKENLEAYLHATMSNLYNTCPFNVTGHPALSVPCEAVNGLPVGMMIIGKHFDESTILRAAHAYEVFKRRK